MYEVLKGVQQEPTSVDHPSRTKAERRAAEFAYFSSRSAQLSTVLAVLACFHSKGKTY